MKKLLYPAFALALLAFVSCTKSETKTEKVAESKTVATPEVKTYGEKIESEGAIAATDLKAQMAGKDSLVVKIKGDIEEVCQVKGCWVTIKTGPEETMRVKFGEDAFFVPKDVTGKTAIMEGVAYKDIIPVDEQRHYLEDAGKSKKEIMAITKPDTALTFTANGIIIQ